MNSPSPNQKQRKSNWILIGLLTFSVLISISMFFYGLIRQFQAEDMAMELAERERACTTLSDELEACQNRDSSPEEASDK